MTYELIRKPVKNINLRVENDGSLRISASPHVSMEKIEQFIISEQKFIENALGRIEQRREEVPVTAKRVRWLGKEYPVRLLSSSRECAVLEQNEIRVFTRFPEDGHVEELLRKFVAESFIGVCRSLNEQVRRELMDSGIVPPPTLITIKDMKSRWGSCSWAKGHISINLRLAAYPRETVLSVFWHEYAHYWHHDHSQRFYAFLNEHCPNYKEWNGVLK